ncbi:hypothetical protein [Halorubrum sp. Ib24]|uniref:hypothetical protein n=1 Tax=Halorubrum sp. Ib24 TaxID=1383850 RepID=UPI00117BC636|nr:hypothetical protein [Halorubrum sp. Ib24]
MESGERRSVINGRGGAHLRATARDRGRRPLRADDLMTSPPRPRDVHRFVRGLLSLLLGLFVGSSVAFVGSPDPTGVFTLVAGLALTVASAAGIYVGIGRL